jgi:hypothetical protein
MGDLFPFVLIGAVVAFFVLRRGESIRFTTVARPANVVMTAIGTVGTKRRWATVTQSEQQVAFAYSKGANWLIALPLMFLFIVPGIVYLVLAGKRESLNVFIEGLGDGSSTVQVTSNGYRGKFAGRALRSQLGVASTAAVSAPLPPSALPEANPILGELPTGEIVPPIAPEAIAPEAIAPEARPWPEQGQA